MLRNRLPEIEIPGDNPFENDKLGRTSCANVFTSLVKMYSATGCVIALNGKWGSGKTTFVKMLMQQMKNNNGHPLYFNAWENDYVEDPLVALLAELKGLSPDSSKWNEVLTKGGKILTSVATSAAKTILKNTLGIDSEVLKSGIDEASSILQKDIDEFAKQKTTFSEFRNALQEYVVENTTEELPVVFFVDELDRCNPRFAVLVLERIKHLFDIPNVVFVLSVNKEQLGYAIQGYYGSANIDAYSYLRRFIDIEYSLPLPQGEMFCQYLYDVYQFGEVFEDNARKHEYAFRSEGDSFKRMAKALVSSARLDLRTTDKIYAHTRLALMTFAKNSYIIPDVFFLLCYLKIANANLYNQIASEKFTAQELLTELENTLSANLFNKDDYNSDWRQMAYSLAQFVLMYTLNDNGIEREHIVDKKDSKKNTLAPKQLDKKTFDEALEWYHGRIHNGVVPLRYLIKKIELEQNIQFLAR